MELTHSRPATANSCFMAIIAILLAAASLVVVEPVIFGGSDAQAFVGRPWTPRSYAGVARRTVRRTTLYVNNLPPSCARVQIDGVTVWSCGGRYYQRYNGSYVVVTIR